MKNMIYVWISSEKENLGKNSWNIFNLIESDILSL